MGVYLLLMEKPNVHHCHSEVQCAPMDGFIIVSSLWLPNLNTRIMHPQVAILAINRLATVTEVLYASMGGFVVVQYTHN